MSQEEVLGGERQSKQMGTGQRNIQVRLYDGTGDVDDPFDWEGIEVGRDTVVVAELGGRLQGLVACRLVPLIHGLQVKPGIVAHRVVDALCQYLNGYLKASSQQEAVMIVKPNNALIHRWLEGRATLDRSMDIFTIGVR
jgi:hypothetical protein